MIEASVYGTLREDTIFCNGAPIQYDEMDRDGRQQLEKFVDAIGATEGVPLDLEAQQLFELQLDVDYVWQANLALNKIDEIVPGDEQGDTSTLWGDWTLELKLMNVQFNETAGEATVSWNGLAGGWTSAGWESGSKENAIKNMVREEFLPITQVIDDYERIPRSADPRPERTVIGSDEEMGITVENIHDHQGRPSRSWQRVVIEVKEGELLNGTPLESAGKRKRYAFTIGDGSLELKYKSPSECELKTEEVKVYNSCTRGQSPVPVRMEVTDPAQEIGSTEFEIVCAEGKIEFWETFRYHGSDPANCTYIEPANVVSFTLIPTKDPCVFNLRGSTSEISTRKSYCDVTVDERPPYRKKTWHHFDLQTRIVGGTVDFRDKRLPPLRPLMEHRRDITRCEKLIIPSYGEPFSGQSGCQYIPDHERKRWHPSYYGWAPDGGVYWGLPLIDGFVDDTGFDGNDGWKYTVHIDEEPFRQFEQSCLDAMEIEGMNNSVPGQGGNK